MTTKITASVLAASASLVRVRSNSGTLRLSVDKVLPLPRGQAAVFAHTNRKAGGAELKQLRASIRKTMAKIGTAAGEVSIAGDRVRFVLRAEAGHVIKAEENPLGQELDNDEVRDPEQLSGPPETKRKLEDYERDTIDLLVRQLKRANQLLDAGDLNAPDYLLDAVHVQLVQATRSLAAALKILFLINKPITDATDEKVEQVERKAGQELKKPVHTGPERRKNPRTSAASVNAAAPLKLPAKFAALADVLDLAGGVKLEEAARMAEDMADAARSQSQVRPELLTRFVSLLPTYAGLKEIIIDFSLADEEMLEEMVNDLRENGQQGTDDELLDSVIKMNVSTALNDLSETDYNQLVKELKQLADSASSKSEGMRTAIQRARDRRQTTAG